MSDLYDTLGVDNDADKSAINKAYKKKAMKVHPDRGGDTDEFKKLQRAHAVLSNDEARARYDSTGEEDVAPAQDNAINELGMLLADAVEKNRSDPIRHCTQLLQQAIANHEVERKGFEKKLKDIEAYRKRIKKQDKLQLFTSVLDNRMASVNQRIEKGEAAIAQGNRMLEILGGYELELSEEQAGMKSLYVTLNERYS